MHKQIQFMSNQKQKHARQEAEMCYYLKEATTRPDLNQEKYEGTSTGKHEA